MRNILIFLVVAAISALPASAQKKYSSKSSTTKVGYSEKSSHHAASSANLPATHHSSANKELAKTEAQSNRILAGSNQGAKNSAPKTTAVASKSPKSDRNAPMNFQYHAPKSHMASNASAHSSSTHGRKH